MTMEELEKRARELAHRLHEFNQSETGTFLAIFKALRVARWEAIEYAADFCASAPKTYDPGACAKRLRWMVIGEVGDPPPPER